MNDLEELIVCFLPFGVCLHYSMCYHYRDFVELQEVDPKCVFDRTQVIRDPLPGICKAMKNFIDPPKASPTKASSSSQPSLLENSQSAGSEGQGQANIVESQDESVLNDPANTD